MLRNLNLRPDLLQCKFYYETLNKICLHNYGLPYNWICVYQNQGNNQRIDSQRFYHSETYQHCSQNLSGCTWISCYALYSASDCLPLTYGRSKYADSYSDTSGNCNSCKEYNAT